MNILKIIILLFFILSIISFEYDGDCENENREYTLKNSDIHENGKYIDYKTNENFTFIASKDDDCKSRTLRKYIVISDIN